MEWPECLPTLLVMAGLLCLSAFFSGSETALFSLSREQRRRLQESKRRSAWLIDRLLHDPKALLVTVLFGNMLVNVGFFSLSYTLAESIRHDARYGTTGATVVGLMGLFTLIVFGEVMPKSMAIQFALPISRLACGPIYLLAKLFRPIRYVFGSVLDVALRFSDRFHSPQGYITAEELKMLIGLCERHGVIDRDEQRMIQDVVEFADIRVREVMVPRVDMALFRLGGRVDEFLALARERRVSKIPVYENTIDEIVGIVHVRDLFLHAEDDVRDHVRPVLFVPESKTVESLLREFRREHRQIAIVVDEYGGTEGLVTLEDILEEIVGEIGDEFDQPEPEPVRRIEEDRYLLSGDLSIREWSGIFGFDVGRGRMNTLGGFVTSLLGHLPRPGERVDYKNLSFEVEAMRGRRVATVLLERRESPQDAPGTANHSIDRSTAS